MKNNFLKRFLTGVAIYLVLLTSLSAQNSLQYTLSEDRSSVSLQIDLKTTKFTVADILNGKRGHPLPESKLYRLDINADTIGVWSGLSPDENIWKLAINVPEAEGFFISFDDFYIPEGGQLYVYNKNHLKDAAVYAYKDNPKGGAYSVENLVGDNVVLEYVSPKNNSEKPKLHLKNVGYKYTEGLNGQLSGFNSSSNYCMVNVNCPEGEPWVNQKKGILQLRMTKRDGKTYLCSGTLVNNTSGDKTPYVLTAYHCFENMTVDEIGNNTEFFFEYESPTCDNTTAPTYKYHKGSQALVLNPIGDGSDGALLKLSEVIPDSWDVYFNGWSRENIGNNISSGSVIHHPLGDVKKITFYTSPLRSGKWENTASVDTHWAVNYSQGATEGGSSGSPIFNPDGLVVGTLTGGDSSCSAPNASDYFGKFWYHWDQYPDASIHMDKYLDPLNTNQNSLKGVKNAFLLDKYNVAMMPNTTTKVNILRGDGEFSVSSSDNSIVTASVADREILLSAVKEGDAELTVKDVYDNEDVIRVSIRKENINIEMSSNNNLAIKTYEEGDELKQVMIFNLDGDTMYKGRDINNTSQSVDMTYYRRGVYIVQVKTKNGATKKEKILW